MRRNLSPWRRMAMRGREEEEEEEEEVRRRRRRAREGPRSVLACCSR